MVSPLIPNCTVNIKFQATDLRQGQQSRLLSLPLETLRTIGLFVAAPNALEESTANAALFSRISVLTYHIAHTSEFEAALQISNATTELCYAVIKRELTKKEGGDKKHSDYEIRLEENKRLRFFYFCFKKDIFIGKSINKNNPLFFQELIKKTNELKENIEKGYRYSPEHTHAREIKLEITTKISTIKKSLNRIAIMDVVSSYTQQPLDQITEEGAKKIVQAIAEKLFDKYSENEQFFVERCIAKSILLNHKKEEFDPDKYSQLMQGIIIRDTF